MRPPAAAGPRPASRLLAGAHAKVWMPSRAKEGAGGSFEASSSRSRLPETNASSEPDGAQPIAETPSAIFRLAPLASASHSSPSPSRKRHCARNANHSPPGENARADASVVTPAPRNAAFPERSEERRVGKERRLGG